MSYSCKSQLQENKLVLPTEKLVCCTSKEYNNVRTSNYPFFFLLYDLSSGHSQEVKNKGTFQTFSSESGRSHLGEVFAYKRFQIK